MDDSLRLQALQSRAEIISGELRGASLRGRILSVPFYERDAWVDELLGLPEAPPDILDLPRGSVPYLPAGVDEILAAVQEAPLRPEDTFVDFGSGLGRVVLLAHLLSGAKSLGVELQLPLVEASRDCGAKLALSDVSFVHANAEEFGASASVYFFYAPFTGEVLQGVLRRLRAQKRPIVLCAVNIEFSDEGWLVHRESSLTSLNFYSSR